MSGNTGSCVYAPQHYPYPLPLAPLHAPHVPQPSYVHHHHELFGPHVAYTRQTPQPSYTQPQGDFCPPSPLGAPPASEAWPNTPDIGTWIDGIDNTAILPTVLQATDSVSSIGMSGSAGAPGPVAPVLTMRRGNTKHMCHKNSLLPSKKENGHKDTSPDLVSNLQIIPPLCSSHINEVITLMETKQELNDKFCETIMKNTAISLKLQLRAAEHAVQQQQNFQKVLLEVIACGLDKVN
ncbi:hypothetical protein K439DRAFT_1618595 [Ramaria rubella]|nr:hypothetical protein K439DRAFT_1618595 [Ramaria rubella]